MNQNFPRPGLYAITPDGISQGSGGLERVALALRGGTRLLQYRDETASESQRVEFGTELLALCRAHRCPLIINNDVELTLRLGAEGCHLGRHDGDLAEARARLGDHALLGASCYSDLNRADRALAAGASYLAFGSVYPSTTKPEAVPASLEILSLARQRFSCPLVAIGGITPDNGGPVVAAGADYLAVIGGIFDRDDIDEAARAFNALYENGSQQHG